jgi:hypothetical protein
MRLAFVVNCVEWRTRAKLNSIESTTLKKSVYSRHVRLCQVHLKKLDGGVRSPRSSA